MRGPTFFAIIGFGAIAAGIAVAGSVSAQPATGTVTGRVLWGSCLRAIPLPMTPDTAAQAPDAAQPGAPARQTQGLPAGAVLVAVQNSSVSARTDEAGRFTLSGVPAGQYLTVAAGPVADSLAATAQRPNVFVNGGQSMDIGTLALGGLPAGGIACRFPVPLDQTQPANPPSDNGNP